MYYVIEIRGKLNIFPLLKKIYKVTQNHLDAILETYAEDDTVEIVIRKYNQ